ncbi:MAG: hypothetical protein KF716_12660 [Anaerolineae bacterium]|nr:hypothetical protein [Anaerolineae bacterium]
MSTRSTWESVRSLFSPQTIPMLISQGVHKRLFPVGVLLLGLILGFVWAYIISPMVNISAEPVHLGSSWKEEWVKQVAWQASASHDYENAKNQLSYIGDAADVIRRMTDPTNPLSQDAALQAQMQPLVDMVNQGVITNNDSELGKITPTLLNSNWTPVLCVIALALLIGIPVIVNTIIPFGLIFAPKSKEPTTVAVGQEAERRRAQDEALKKAKEAPPAPVAAGTVDRGAPVSKFVSTFVMGDDLFDDSFSIETSSGEFLGETGAGISKTIGVGDPKKVTAIEVWVFDKNDIRTVTKVLMSDYAFGDAALKAELATKGEAVQAAPGGITLLETQTLTVQARIIDMAYGSGSLPTNSFFERMSIEISAWPKKADAGASGVSDAFGQTGPTRVS